MRGAKLNGIKTMMDRKAELPTVEEQLEFYGIALDADSVYNLTAFCWINGFDKALIYLEDITG